jgi:predicted DsbA family dithiol-disulfide isomerase
VAVAPRLDGTEIEPPEGRVERELLVFADYVCPYCYLAEAELHRLQADGARLERAAFELRPAGTPLPRARGSWLQDAWERTIEPLARDLGVTIRFPELATRTRKAHEAAAYARAEGALDAMHAAIYRAYWENGLDIGRIDVLVEVGAKVGLDRGGLRVALDIDQWSARVEVDVAAAAQLELDGVPAYILKREPASTGSRPREEVRVGLQRYDELRSWVMAE